MTDIKALADELAEHWLFDIGCVHDDGLTGGSNKPSCSCGWTGARVSTVGAAAKLWAQHALTALRTPADRAEKAEALLREAREASEQARDILETYIGFLHHIPAADLEMHPYIPSVEGAFDLASSAVTRIDAHLAGEPGQGDEE